MSLARYAELATALKTGLDAVEAPASFYSPLNVIGRIGMGKWTIEERDGFWAFVSDGVARVIPTGDKAEYYQAILAWSFRHEVHFVPEYMADVFRKRGLKVAKLHDEYILHPDKLADLAGGSLRGLRSDRNRALKVVSYDEADLQSRAIVSDLLELNDRWYREAKTRLWRPSEKAQIEWMLKNWSDVLDLEPSARVVLIRDKQGKLPISFEAGSHLTATLASSFTQRSDREYMTGAFSGANLIATLALVGLLGRPSNDGPADTKELAQRKTKMASKVLTFYSVSGK